MNLTFSKERFAPLGALYLVASVGAIVASPAAHARSSYGSAWDGIYTNSASHTNSGCQLCHADSTQYLNPYGEAICLSGGTDISARIRAVEAQDSDNDPTGANNQKEIGVSAQPGWTAGIVNPTFFRGDCSTTGMVEAPPSYVMGSIDPVSGNQPPVADAKGPYSGTVNMSLAFDGSASHDSDGSIVAYDWDFGDGSTGSGVSPSHIYTTAGSYSVSLTVTDDGGATGSVMTSATIGLGNQPPVAVANGPYSGMVGNSISFDSTGSKDPDGSIVSYTWSFGDGSTSASANPTHMYAAAGTYNVTLTVMDDAGARDSAATSANIVDQPANQLPVSDPGGPYTGTVGVIVGFDGSASNDPDGNIVDYSWDFGDGTSGSGVTPTHTYTTEGNFNVSLIVTDDAGATHTATTAATIGVANQPPIADAGGPYSGTVDFSVAFDGTASNDTDGSIVDYSWDFGDGSTGSGAMPTHTYTVDGNYTVTLTVTDDAGAKDSNSTGATIGAGNLSPVADPAGPYTVTVGDMVAFDGSGSVDPDGTIVAYDWDFGDGTSGTGQAPMHAYASAGTYNVTLAVTDDSGSTDSASTTVTVNPPADVNLDKLQTPGSIKASTSRGISKGIVAVGNSTSIDQSATVTLNASVIGPVTVDIAPTSVTDLVTAGNGGTRYKFNADITCDSAGEASIEWTATISSDQNSDTSNDTVTSMTTVSCR